MPSELNDFLEGTKNERGTIKVMLINDAMLNSKSMTRDDYDQTLIGSTSCPIDGLKITRPIVIIDEPHRFKRNGAAYKAIQNLDPQSIIRFGATFPLKDTRTKGVRGKSAVPDYYQSRPQFDLGAVEAFNQDLVKGVSIQYPEINGQEPDKYRVKSVTTKELVLEKAGMNDGRAQKWTVKVGEDLSVTGGSFEGEITYMGQKRLSNELELSPGMILTANIFANTYQQLMINQALDAHFNTEIENFHRAQNNEQELTKRYMLAFERLADGKIEELFSEVLDKETKEQINARLNFTTLEKIIACWTAKFQETFAQRYEYSALNYTAETSIMETVVL